MLPDIDSNVNILIRGQSNAAYFSLDAGRAMAGEVAALLGFDGRTATVTLIGGPGRTEHAATALIWDQVGGRAWMSPAPGGQGWVPNANEQQVLDTLKALPAPVRRSPTLTLWLHNESDCNNPDVTRETWASAIRADAGWVRAALGQTAATTPYLFAWVPFEIGAGPVALEVQDRKAQAMRLGMQDLAADQSFHAVAAPQTGDLDMNGAGGRFGGMHMSVPDALVLADRLARVAACELSGYARPGAPVRSLDCGHPGPVALAATRLAADRVAIEAAPHGAPIAPLGLAAAHGAGWVARLPGGISVPARAARLVAPTRLELVFSIPLPADARIHYGYGHGRISAENGTGAGAAIYDQNGEPMSAPIEGLPVRD